jgi:hypothetical protein
VSHGQPNVRTGTYKQLLEKLPKNIQEMAQEAFEAFERDPHDPMLDSHPLKDTKKGRHKKGSVAVSVSYRYPSHLRD